MQSERSHYILYLIREERAVIVILTEQFFWFVICVSGGHVRLSFQMLFLYTVLDMGDHHSANMGVDDKGHPYIVDFCLMSRASSDVKKDFYQEVRLAKRIR